MNITARILTSLFVGVAGLALVRRDLVVFVLHGNDHVQSTTWFEGPHGRVPAVGVPSASAVAHRH